MEELKLCPFCGSEAELQIKRPYRGKRTTSEYRVIDRNFECSMFPVTRWYGTEREAIAAWNRRPDHGTD